MTYKERFEKIITYFKINQPIAETELTYNNAYELLVAVILSAQCTDKRVNEITKTLFKRFPYPQKLAEADIAEVFEYIKSCSYPNNKAKHLVGMAQMLVNNFNNTVPSNLDDLLKLPGVGRKTANVILSVVYNQPALAVDTHVFRVAARLGLTHNAKNPFEAEKQLVKHIEKEWIPTAHHWLILHGRYVCKARTPNCNECNIKDLCLFFENKDKKIQTNEELMPL